MRVSSDPKQSAALSQKNKNKILRGHAADEPGLVFFDDLPKEVGADEGWRVPRLVFLGQSRGFEGME